MRYRPKSLLQAAISGALLMVLSTAAQTAQPGGNGLIKRPSKACCSWAELFRQRRANEWAADKITPRDHGQKVAVLDKYEKLFELYDQLAVALQKSASVPGTVVASAPRHVAEEWEPNYLLSRANQHWGQGKWGMNAMVSVKAMLENDRPVELWEKFYSILRVDLVNRFEQFKLELPPELR